MVGGDGGATTGSGTETWSHRQALHRKMEMLLLLGGAGGGGNIRYHR